MLILVDSVYKSEKSYYPQGLLEECKYLVKDKEIKSFITKNSSLSKDENQDES